VPHRRRFVVQRLSTASRESRRWEPRAKEADALDFKVIKPPVAKPRPEKQSKPSAPAEHRVLPMELRIGDRLTDETGVWEVIGRPYTSPNGKIVHARVQRVGQFSGTVLFAWGAHERVTVKRASAEED